MEDGLILEIILENNNLEEKKKRVHLKLVTYFVNLKS